MLPFFSHLYNLRYKKTGGSMKSLFCVVLFVILSYGQVENKLPFDRCNSELAMCLIFSSDNDSEFTMKYWAFKPDEKIMSEGYLTLTKNYKFVSLTDFSSNLNKKLFLDMAYDCFKERL
jgi:hypothetical protein